MSLLLCFLIPCSSAAFNHTEVAETEEKNGEVSIKYILMGQNGNILHPWQIFIMQI